MALVVKAPSLVSSGLAGTMEQNLSKLARGFGCEKAQLLKAVKSFPRLAYQKPERLMVALKAGGKTLGVNKKVLVAAVLRSPTLLLRKMDGWSRRMRLVIRIARALGTETSSDDVLKMFPAAMTYASGRLLQRYVIARLGLWTWNWMALLSLPDLKARALLNNYFEEHAKRAPLRKALQGRGLL